MFQRRTIITLIILFIIYLGVVYAGRQRKVTPQLLQPDATSSHQTPITNDAHLLTDQPAPLQPNIHNRLN